MSTNTTTSTTAIPPSPKPTPPPPSSPFTVTAPPTKDVWRKPPTTNKFDAPLSALHRGPLASFRRAALTVTLPPRADLTTYDQGSLLLAITRPGASVREAGASSRWLKTGIEMWRGEPWLSTVACEAWADASLLPLVAGDKPAAKVEVEREGGGEGLWVYLWGEGGRVPLREVCWFFADGDEEWEVSVAACAARPLEREGREGEEVTVEFEGLEVEWG